MKEDEEEETDGEDSDVQDVSENGTTLDSNEEE